MGVVKNISGAEWEKLAEDCSFVFYSCDRRGRIHYVNSTWQDLVERQNAPEFLAYANLNQNVYDAFERTGLNRYLYPFEFIRRGDASHFEEIVPCHAPNQYRWMLLRLQRLGEEMIFSSYFLRHYGEDPPQRPKIRCLTDGGDWTNNWKPDGTPLDTETTLALCPNCSLQFYTHLREAA